MISNLINDQLWAIIEVFPETLWSVSDGDKLFFATSEDQARRLVSWLPIYLP